MVSAAKSSYTQRGRASDSLSRYMEGCRDVALAEMTGNLPVNGAYGEVLYRLMLDYPLREGKALRPALAIATCRALGGSLEAVAKSAAVLELYHNAFLIHDDVEDGSEKRRDGPTLHRAHGAAIAVNVGDAMLALALEPLLDNMRLVGMGAALRILKQIARMARESAEGQALELSWIRSGNFTLRDRDYLRMVHKKTSHYTFITPMVIGAMVAGAPSSELESIGRVATLMGMAFQIQDDVLNLVGDEKVYGKELRGDLWEGKHTLVLLHALENASRAERAAALAILKRPRPNAPESEGPRTLETLVRNLLEQGEMRGDVAARLRTALDAEREQAPKSQADVDFLFELVQRTGSIEYARGVARRRAERAGRILGAAASWRRPSVHYDFISDLIAFIAERDR
jgi:geranylgeranyl diphosphate synthase type II